MTVNDKTKNKIKVTEYHLCPKCLKDMASPRTLLVAGILYGVGASEHEVFQGDVAGLELIYSGGKKQVLLTTTCGYCRNRQILSFFLKINLTEADTLLK